MKKIVFLSAILTASIVLGCCKANNSDTRKSQSRSTDTKLDVSNTSSDFKVQRRSLGCGPVPTSFRGPPYNLDPFYQRYCDANGLPILSSSNVNPDALRIAMRRINVMSEKLPPEVIQAMIDANTRIAIIGKSENLTDIPEHSDMNEAFPERDWNKRTRGLGATKQRPAASIGEENVLCIKGNTHPGSDIFVHEYAHVIHYMGLNNLSSDFQTELNKAYRNAVQKKGLWKNTYASKNSSEYWAMAVQIWFNVNYSTTDADENYIRTKAQLKYYDPVIYDLVARYMPDKPILIC